MRPIAQCAKVLASEFDTGYQLTGQAICDLDAINNNGI